jgi:hypothetical protein
MSEVIKRIEKNGKVLEIVIDECPESPRNWDNLCKMIFFNKYKSWGDNHDVEIENSYSDRHDFISNGCKEVTAQIKDVAIIKPVHVYQHSGTSISTNYSYPFDCRWDSGTIGFVVVTKDDIRKNFNVKRVTQTLIDKANEILEAEIETLNHYISGSVYGFIVRDEKENIEDSCYGFYGDDFKTNGMDSYVAEEFIAEL